MVQREGREPERTVAPYEAAGVTRRGWMRCMIVNTKVAGFGRAGRGGQEAAGGGETRGGKVWLTRLREMSRVT